MIAAGADWRSVKLSSFTAYFDASGTEHDQKCLAVAGYLATAEQWIDFEKLWIDRLSLDGLDFFHATEIKARWANDPERLATLYADLIRIISENVLRQFGCCVLISSLNQWPRADRELWSMTAYGIAGRASAGQMRTWCRTQGFSVLPEMIFECGDTDSDSLARLLKSDEFPDPVFKPKRDTTKKGMLVRGAVPLQAADLLAYELFSPAREFENNGAVKSISREYSKLEEIEGKPSVILVKTIEQLRKLATMDEGDIWFPSGPDDKPLPGL
jgi:hypothetical protein